MDFDYDVDDQGILDTGELIVEAEPVARREQDVLAQGATGNRNVVAGGNVHQFISLSFGTSAEEKPTARVKKPQGRGLLDPTALEKLEQNYVLPPGLLGEEDTSAVSILRKRHMLMIAAEEPASGQFSAGVRLSYELRKDNPALVVREELIDSEFELTAQYLQLERDPTALLVDLRDSGDEIDAMGRNMVDFFNVLERYHSYLILVIPYDRVGRMEEQFPERVHRLGKPSSVEVFARHLGQVEAHAAVMAEVKTRAAELERLWPPKVKELVGAVSNGIVRGEDPVHTLRAALQRKTPDLRAVIREKQEKGEPEWLALLLAAGMLEGAEPRHIVGAATDMLAYNNLVEQDEVAPLLVPSPHSRLTRLDLDSFEPETREFQPSGFGVQVLRHFWREHPDLRDIIVTWIGRLPRVYRDLSTEELEQIADRSAEIASEGGYLVAVGLAEEWAKTTPGKDEETAPQHSINRYRRSVAVRLLTTTAADTALGGGIRQKLLDWSKGKDADLQVLTAEVCAGLAHSFPRIALTRLKHLANSSNPHVRKAVLVGIKQVADELGVSRFLRYLPEWFDSANPERLQLLSEGVTTVLKEQKGDVEPEAADSFWREALDKLLPENLRPVVGSWLRLAATRPEAEWAVMVEPLVKSTKSDSLRIAQMQYASRTDRMSLDLRAIGDEQLAGVMHLLWTRLDEVDPILRQE
jgi:hypothetical protein